MFLCSRVVFADTQTWTFDVSGDYTYNDTLINVTSGAASLRATTSPSWYNTSWGYRKAITIESDQVSADVTNFPVLISITDSDLTARAQADGDDILFTASDGQTKLSHEIERYVSATGTLTAWVKTSLSGSVDTTIYMYYGNAAAIDQSSATSTWDSSFSMVHHMSATTSSGSYANYPDATLFNNDGVGVSVSIVSRDATKYEGFPSISVMPDGSWIIAYKKGTAHVDDDADSQIVFRTSTDRGTTWSAETVISPTPTTNMNWQNVWVSTVDSRVFMFLMENASASSSKSWLRYSDDNGSTWSSPAEVTSTLLAARWFQHGRVIKDSEGNLLTSGFGYETNGQHKGIALLKSTDNGITWNDVVSFVPVVADYSEPDIARAPNGDLLFITRYDSGNNTVLYRSTDNGDTWSSSQNIGYQIHSPIFLRNGNDMLLLGREYGTSSAVVLISSDNGATWGSKSVINKYGLTQSDGGYVDGFLDTTNNNQLVLTFYTNDGTVGSYPYISLGKYGLNSSAGKIESALVGSDGSHMRMSSSTGIRLNSGVFTTSMWIRPDFDLDQRTDGAGTDVTLISKERVSGSGLTAYSWKLDTATNKQQFTAWNSSDVLVVNVFGNKTSWNEDEWYHLSLVSDGSNYTFYVNGSSDGTTADSDEPSNDSGQVVLGYVSWSTSNFQPFLGYMDEVHISSVARSSDWLLTEYNNQNSTSTFYTIGPEVSLYPTTSPSIYPTASVSVASLSGFSSSETLNGGTIKFQVSNDTGSTWYWYNSGWSTTAAGYSESNTASQINSAINSFSLGAGDFMFKAFLNSNGTQLVGLNDVTITYSTDATAPTITSISSDKTNGLYGVGEVIDIDVTFSETVTSTGNVTVTLETGSTDRTCTFSVANASNGTCNYTVQSGDESSDLTVSSVSGTIVDAIGNSMINFVPTTNLATSKALVIDAAPPVLSSGSPTGQQVAGTDSVSLSLTTNEGARCRYGSVTETTYHSISQEFSSGTTTTHTSTLSGLSTGSYTYYVRCQDALGNSNTTDYSIAFSIPSTSTGGNGPLMVGGFSTTFPWVPPSRPQIRYPDGRIVYTDTDTNIVIASQPDNISFSEKLFLGSRGHDVIRLQQFLSGDPLLYPEALVTGYFGLLTEAALKRFQLKYGIVTTGNSSHDSEFGVLGPNTQKKLNELLVDTTQGSSSDYNQVFTRSMSEGIIDPLVIVLQKILNSHPDTIVVVSGPGSPGNETNFFGPLTKKAVQRFQYMYGISNEQDIAFGYVGPKTREKLNMLIQEAKE